MEVVCLPWACRDDHRHWHSHLIYFAAPAILAVLQSVAAALLTMAKGVTKLCHRTLQLELQHVSVPMSLAVPQTGRCE